MELLHPVQRKCIKVPKIPNKPYFVVFLVLSAPYFHQPQMKDRILIGRCDYADFPELGLKRIGVKVDTGAYTSSIYCSKIEPLTVNGKNAIKCTIMDCDVPGSSDVVFTDFTQKSISTSTGNPELRYVIKTTIILFGEKYPIELSLAGRRERRFPILLGRKLLNHRFVVDTGRRNLSVKGKRRLVRVEKVASKGKNK